MQSGNCLKRTSQVDLPRNNEFTFRILLPTLPAFSVVGVTSAMVIPAFCPSESQEFEFVFSID
jgi:hypothetical protein